MRTRWVFYILMAIFLSLWGCAPPPLAIQPSRLTIQGKAIFPPLANVPFNLLQLPAELVQKTTVSLIDPSTGQTMATGLTDITGNFTFFPDAQLTIADGQIFYLEAVRGLNNNAVGSSAARLRTFLRWTGNGWVTLTGKVVILNPATTTVAVVQGIKNQNINNFFNALSPIIDPVSSAFNQGLTGIDPLEYNKVLQTVTNTLQADLDPVTHVKFDNDGLFYYNTVVALPTLSGKVTSLIGGKVDRDGVGLQATFLFPWGLEADSSGSNLYITGFYSNKIRKLNLATKQVTTFSGSGIYGYLNGPAASARFLYPTDSCFDGTRNKIYVVDRYSHRIRELNATTGDATILVGSGSATFLDGNGTAAAFYYPMGCVFDGGQYLYIADEYNHAIRRVDLNTKDVMTIAGGSPGLLDGNGVAARFYYPADMGIDKVNKILYVADRANHAIRQIDVNPISPQFQDVTTIAGGQINGQGFGVAGYADGIANAALFYDPYDVAFDSSNNVLYVADYSNVRIRKVDVATQATTTFFDYNGGTTGQMDGPITTATQNRAISLALSGTKLYFTDYINHLIRQVDLASPTLDVTTLAGSNHLDGVGADTRLLNVNGITGPVKEGDKYLFLAETYNHIISRFDLDTGDLQVIAGQKGLPGYADGIGVAAKFNNPYRLVYDGAQFLYVTDRDNDSIRKIDIFSFQVTTINGGPSTGNPNDGPVAAMTFTDPSGIAYDKTAKKLYIMDNTRLREVDLFNGTVTTLAGSASAGTVDGTLAASRFNGAHSLVYLGKGRFFTIQGQTIREINIPKDQVNTVAGTAAGYADGPGVTAAFYNPKDLVSDGVGNIFISDYDNHRIRKYEVATSEVSSIIGGGSGVPILDSRGASARLIYPYALYYDRLVNKLYMGEYANSAWNIGNILYGGNTVKVIE